MKNTIFCIVLITWAVLCLVGCNRQTAQSVQYIEGIHDCALLVRLPQLDDQVSKLTESGRINQAEALRKYNIDFNTAVMDDFKKNYDFSPVYFFYSDDSDKVSKNELDGIFIGSDLKRDPNIKISCDNYLIMDFGDPKKESTTRMSVKWVVKDQNFKVLPKPFPYHILWGKSSEEIERFNQRFYDYHASALEYKLEQELLQAEESE